MFNFISCAFPPDVEWIFRSGKAEWKAAEVANLKGSQVQPKGLNRRAIAAHR